jgi:hypothetical protein
MQNNKKKKKKKKKKRKKKKRKEKVGKLQTLSLKFEVITNNSLGFKK